MPLELASGEEFEDLLDSLYWGDLEYITGWIIESDEGEGMGFLRKGPLWTKEDEVPAPVWTGPIKFDQECGKLDISVKLPEPAERVVIISASVLDPQTDHCISISVQVSNIPTGLTGKEALTYALREVALQEIT